MDRREIGSALNLSGAGRGTVAGFCERGDENEWPSKAKALSIAGGGLCWTGFILKWTNTQIQSNFTSAHHALWGLLSY